jgi:hypothetical protein
MAKRMSRTLAAEIADRTLAVVNPQNRFLAICAGLGRHGFARPSEEPELADRAALIDWLVTTYSARS